MSQAHETGNEDHACCGPGYATPEEAAKDPDFAIQGEYTGEGVDGSGANHQLGIQIVALGKGTFQATAFQGGLPGAGWGWCPNTAALEVIQP